MQKKRIGKYIISPNEELGKGAFAKVVGGENQQTKQAVAVKVVSKVKIQEDEYTKNAFYSEIQIMKKLKSKNIIKFYDVHETKNNFYIVLELAQGGTLRKQLQLQIQKRKQQNSSFRCFDEKMALICLIQILNGFGQLIKYGVVHRDLKPDNILINADTLKIADFGFAKYSQNNSFLKTIVGTPAYMAPQILSQQKYTYKCDIWALGVIAYQMVVGRIPWLCKQKNLMAIRNEICGTKITFPPDLQISNNYKNFVLGCLCIDESERLDWQQIFSHPLFGNKFKQNLENKKEGAMQISFIISNFRMELHSSNINMTKLLSKEKNQMSFIQFERLLKLVYKQISKEETITIFNYLVKKQIGVVLLQDFKDLLIKYQCRMTGFDLTQKIMEGENNMNQVYLLIARLKNRIHKEGIDLTKLYQSKDYLKNNALSLQTFGALICEIDPSFVEAQIRCLYTEFDINHDGLISFSEFSQGICKIAEVVWTTPLQPMQAE